MNRVATILTLGAVLALSLVEVAAALLKKFFNTYVYGKSPTPLLKEILR